ncbi:MAG: aspartate carbamoyltransferase catalytic subunit [Deltaproteobacteria bacterium]|nr:aspartate carbamoyltransferase catalytic subunit [Deltaproteobacteria bacterium]
MAEDLLGTGREVFFCRRPGRGVGVRRSLVSINDLTNEEVEAVFVGADEMASLLRRGGPLDLCRGKILCTLFYEPSTRTRLSFESAMHRLGGAVLSTENARVSSSAAKGETIRDSVRVVQHYADLLVMRHYLDGSTRVAAECARIPVISGGDGTHEHPTQTLCDLYTMRKEKGKVQGLHVALCGDLRYGRTVHSLAYGLARFGARITCVAPPGFQLPAHVRERLLREYGCRIREFSRLDEAIAGEASAPRRRSGDGLYQDLIEQFDVLYLTRVQKERLPRGEGPALAAESFRLSRALLRKAQEDALVLHPLPRVNELDYDVDEDKRAGYFRQASYGVAVRMALTALFLGVVRSGGFAPGPRPRLSVRSVRVRGVRCINDRCVSLSEPDVRPRFVPAAEAGGLRCAYCEVEVRPPTRGRGELFR